MAKLPTGIVTFLFTDLEGSTRLWEHQPDAMHEALAQHDAILMRAIESHDGVVFSKMGDGMAAAFGSAGDAVAAALAAQLALATAPWGATGPLRVRMGLHAAEAQLRSDVDYVNRPLNQCARLMAVASGGQVLASNAAETLARGNLPADTSFIDLGSHRLRDLADAVHIFQVAHPELLVDFPPLRSLDAFPAITTMPKPSIVREERRLAGRSGELDALARAWTRATDGSRQVTLVMGEPGIGKTRLAGELSRQVDAQGGVVLYGGCDEDTIIPYQPFVEALRPFVAAYPLSTMHQRLHGLEQDLTRVFPELLGRFAASPRSRARDPEAERYRLFEAITALLTGIATAQSTLLVLDDLHWADKPTALLLRHVIRSTPEAALHIVACYRDVEVPRDHPLANLLSDLRRESFVERVTVRGLTEADTGALLDDLAGQPLTASLSGALHRETGGNPLFVAELFRHLTETEVLPRPPNAPLEIDFGPLDLPDGVREVVARRLTRLPAEVNDVLRLAAVFGSEFGAVLLGRATEAPVDEILGSLEQAQTAGLVEEHPDRLGWYTFAHALVRQTLYSELGTARRARLHARAGVAMEQTTGLRPPAAALAHHFTQAVPLGQAPKAIEYTTKAGHEAVADLAFEEAAAAFEAVLALLEQHAPEDAAQRVDVLTDLADALVYVDERAGVEAALRAVEAARAHGSARQLGRAVTVFVEPASAVSVVRVDVVDLFDEAMAALGDEHADLRAHLLALMAFKYAVYQLQGRDGGALAREAADLARAVGDAETLADALYALAVSSEGSAVVSNRLALGEELVGLGRSGSGRAAKATAYGLRILAGVHLELGDAELLTSTIAELARVGHDQRWLPARVYAAQWEATQALLEARFDDVLTCWKEMRGLVPAYRGAASMQATQMYYLAREQGGLGDLASVLERIAEENQENLYVRAMLALAQCDAGDDAAARQTLELLLADDFRSRAQESSWGAVLGLLAEVAAETNARSQAKLLYELLIPFEGRLLTAVLGLGCLGAADRYLGMLSTVAERWDAAEAHFERALAVEERIRGRGLLARTRYWHARFVRARGREGDQRAAADLLSEVADEASGLGLRRVAESAEALLGA